MSEIEKIKAALERYIDKIKKIDKSSSAEIEKIGMVKRELTSICYSKCYEISTIYTEAVIYWQDNYDAKFKFNVGDKVRLRRNDYNHYIAVIVERDKYWGWQDEIQGVWHFQQDTESVPEIRYGLRFEDEELERYRGGITRAKEDDLEPAEDAKDE